MTEKNRSVYIYGLVDPRDKQIHYVGQTVNLSQRYSEHMKNDDYNPEKWMWIKNMLFDGTKPEMVILETVTKTSDWVDSEKQWIRRGYFEGWPLVNITHGSGIRDQTASFVNMIFVKYQLLGLFREEDVNKTTDEKIDLIVIEAKNGLAEIREYFTKWWNNA